MILCSILPRERRVASRPEPGFYSIPILIECNEFRKRGRFGGSDSLTTVDRQAKCSYGIV